MLQLQLYIEGKEVELYKDESITLTQSIQDIKDISKVFTDFTRTFNVPASKANNKIFKHFYNFHIRTFNTKSGEFESYDARKKKEAELLLNHKPFKEGRIKFEGVQLKNNEPHTYKLTFFGNTINLKDILGEDKLSNLAQLSLFDFEYNDTNIITYMANGKDVNFFGGTIEDAIIFPLITHTGRLLFDVSNANDATNNIYNVHPLAGATNNHGVPLSQLKPAIRLYAIVKAIENQVGYNLQFSSDFFNSTNLNFYKLYMWLHNKEGGLFQDQDAQYQITGFNNVVGDVAQIQGVTNKTFVNSYNEENEERVLRVNVRPSSTASYNLVIKQDGEEFQRFDNLTGITTNGIADFKNEDIELPNGTYTFFIETDVVSDYDVDFSVDSKVRGIFSGNKTITVKDATASFATDKDVNITTIIPDMKVIDFITGLFKMFNLTAYQNESGTIVIQPLDDFFAASTKVWDITKDLDKKETTVNSILPFKDISFKYKSTGSFLANNHKELSNKDWGSLEYKMQEKYDGKNYTVELPFEHFKYEHLYTTDAGVIQTTTTADGDEKKTDSGIQYGYSVDEKQAPYLGEPLIFYANTSLSSVRVINLDGSANATAVSGVYMPSNSTGILNVFGTSFYQTLNFNAEYEEYSRQVNQTTLFKTYYKGYVEDMFDKRKRLTTVKAYLPLELLVKLNLADKIIVFDDIYRINKITTNFETNLSTLELTNIFEEVTYKTIKYVAQNCLTVDTSKTQTDNNILTVDAGCETDFVIPDLTLDDPNPPNDPEPVYDETPLEVTPPVIAEYTVTAPTTTSVFFNHQITELGKLGDTPQVDEYGFVYSTSLSDISSSDDVIQLFNTGNVYFVPYTPLNPNFAVPKIVNYEKSGLTHPQTYYWRFYARTNTDPAHAEATAISEVFTASTVAAPVSQFRNTTGEYFSDYHTINNWAYFLQNQSFTTNSDHPLVAGLSGQEIRPQLTAEAYTLQDAKKIVEWFTSVANPQIETLYSISHTFEYYDSTGTMIYQMVDVSDAQIMYAVNGFNQLTTFIVGGTFTEQQPYIQGVFGNSGDFKSTSG
jgi:hypothetical protein